MILADSNVWIRHLRQGDTRLRQFLVEQRVRTSDVVIGELLLGAGLPKQFAADLSVLPRLPTPPATETRVFVEHHRRAFAGSGVGWADVQVILTAMKAGARIHTSDRGVLKVCRSLGCPLAA